LNFFCWTRLIQSYLEDGPEGPS